MNRKTSAKQIAANRRNARKSTGPRTPEGIAVSKMNALKHGILSREVLVYGLHLQESAAELEALHQRFRDDLDPKGPLEEMLVDQIVTAHWRLRRALTAESGEIALSVDAGHRRRSEGMDPVLQWMKWTVVGDPVYAMEKSTLGVRILLDWMNEVRAAIESDGSLTEAAVQKLAGHFNGAPNSLVPALEAFRRDQVLQSAGSDDTLRTQQKTEALAFMDRKLNGLRFTLEHREEEAIYAAEAGGAASVLPSADVLEKILRYETKLERQMYRAMAQLERIQRMRRGEAIPAPLSVEVSHRE